MKPFRLALLLLLSCAPDHVVLGRPYALKTPKTISPGEQLPLVVLLHGYSANGEIQDIVFPFSSVVESKRFLYALPDGSRNAAGERFWNATNACCDFEHRGVDDVGFLRAVIADVKAQYPVDSSRVYLVGHSNGAFMALRMACEASDVVTGVVSVAGAAKEPFTTCPGPAIRVLQIHGTADDTIHYDGGVTNGGGPYPAAAETIRDYAARNGCAATSTFGEPLDLVGDATAETTREVFDGCPAQAPVELWSVGNAGHVPSFNAAWPGRVIDWLENGTP